MKISKIVLYTGLAVLALVIVAEVLVRLMFSQPLDPGRTFILANEIEGLKNKVTFKIDSNQVRGFDSTKPKASGALRVLCVGGAATTTMLQNAEDTWWGQLGGQLEKSLGKQIEIGCITSPDSMDVLGGAQWLDHVLGEVEGVDLVLAMNGRVEVLHARADFSFDPNAIVPVKIETKGGLMFGLAKVSHFVRVARNMHIKSKRNEQQRRFGSTNYLRDRFTQAGQAYRSIPAASSPVRTNDPIGAYLHGVGMMIEVARRNGTKLILIGEPTIFSALPRPDAAGSLHTPVHVGPGDNEVARPIPGWVDSELGRYYAGGAAVAEVAGVPFVNLQSVILPMRENFFTESSLTDIGASRVADELLSDLEAVLN